MIVRRLAASSDARCRASLSLIAEGVLGHEIKRCTGITWDHVRQEGRDHAALRFDAQFVSIASLESACDPALPPDLHVRAVLDRAEPGDSALRNFVDRGALLTVHVRVIGKMFFDDISIGDSELRRIGRLSARVSWSGSALESWEEIAERLKSHGILGDG